MSFTNFFKACVFTFLILFAVPSLACATNTTTPFTNTPADSLADVQTATRITKRVYEIQAMDKTNLSSAEKKALKKELKDLKVQAQAVERTRGVYLSVGAIIIIILLLIIIL